MVTVRVVRERMGNNVPNQPVTLKVGDRTLNGEDRRAGPRAVRRAAAGTVVQATTTSSTARR